MRRAIAGLWLLGLGACMPGEARLRPAAAPEPESAPPIPAPCRSLDPDTIAGCVDAERFAADVRAVARMRPPGSPHHLRVQLRCAETFERWGWEVELHRYATGTNVIGHREGTDPHAPGVLVGAHYDHIAGCEGADDNASGVSAVLELSRVLAGVPTPRPVTVACWDEEERGLVGSRAWAMRARERGTEIAVYFNFDAIAYTDDRPGAQAVPGGLGLLFSDELERLHAREDRADFIALVADPRAAPHARRVAAHADRDGLPAVVLEIPDLVKDSRIVYDLRRSDHASLWDAGYPAVMITDTANFRSPAYHCHEIADTADTLDLPFATRVVRATAAAVVQALVAGGARS